MTLTQRIEIVQRRYLRVKRLVEAKRLSASRAAVLCETTAVAQAAEVFLARGVAVASVNNLSGLADLFAFVVIHGTTCTRGCCAFEIEDRADGIHVFGKSAGVEFHDVIDIGLTPRWAASRVN